MKIYLSYCFVAILREYNASSQVVPLVICVYVATYVCKYILKELSHKSHNMHIFSKKLLTVLIYENNVKTIV